MQGGEDCARAGPGMRQAEPRHIAVILTDVLDFTLHALEQSQKRQLTCVGNPPVPATFILIAQASKM
jgi:hypothetical protein